MGENFEVDLDFEFNAPQWCDFSQEQDPFADAWLDTPESYFSADCKPKKRKTKRATLPSGDIILSENIPMNSLRTKKQSLVTPVKTPPVMPIENLPPKTEEVVVKKNVVTRKPTAAYQSFMNFRSIGFW